MFGQLPTLLPVVLVRSSLSLHSIPSEAEATVDAFYFAWTFGWFPVWELFRVVNSEALAQRPGLGEKLLDCSGGGQELPGRRLPAGLPAGQQLSAASLRLSPVG